MSQLALVTVVDAIALMTLGACLAVWPKQSATWIAGFPRNVWAGRILAAVDLAWVLLILLTARMNWIDNYRLLVIALAPVAYAIVVVLMDDLLAARALGGLLLLVPLPLLDAAFIHPSPARLAMVLFAFLLVVMGIVLVWSPYMFRKMMARWIGRIAVTRSLGLAGMGLGLIFFGLGMWVF